MDYKEKTYRILDLMSKRSAVAPPEQPYDLRFIGVDRLPWKSLFSTFNSQQVKEASKIIQVLVAAYDFDDFLTLADQVRTFESDGMFLYVLYSSVLSRDDCTGVILPPIEECSPHWFFAAETIHEAIQLSIHRPNEDHIVINQRTAEDTEPESRLAYFREDISMITHHWTWHVIYPSNASVTGKIKDRQGEIFYYMHQQMIARYNCERLSNGFNRVMPLQNFREKLIGYSPHMTSQITGVHIASRPPGLSMRDLPTVSVNDLEIWRFRIIDSIDKKFLQDASGNFISLDNLEGIDILGALVEPNSHSINRDFYGNLHNSGHNILANVHDPDGRFREQPGVMAFIESAPRDPVFYQWHAFIDDLFHRHKSTLTPYTRDELSFDGIRVVNAEVNAAEKNVIQTFIRHDWSDLSHAPFLRTNKTILVQYEHLDHESVTFTYHIENNMTEEKEATIRVFMGPKYDERGNLFDLNEQRRLMFEIDKFHQRLLPGLNTVIRKDSASTVTIPRQRRSYRMLQEGNFDSELDYCTCGWPDHMLVPRGTESGMEFNLFVMCTNYDDDKPDVEPRRIACSDAFSYCGSKDQKYPDKKPMGFPFDRPTSARTMTMFLTPNMILTDVRIKFLGLIKHVKEWTVKMSGST